MTDPAAFRRAVLAVGAEGADRRLVRAAAEFARLLELEMLGVFIEDPSVLSVAGFPFARELRLPGHDWRPLESRQVGDELQALGRRARDLFQQEARSLGLSPHFEVRRCDPGQVPVGMARPTDILIVAAPRAADLLASGLARRRVAALECPASLLLLPSTGLPASGPVAVVAASRSDRSVVLASRFAAAVHEQAILVPADRNTSASSVRASLQNAVGSGRERLLVLARGRSEGIDQTFLQLATDRGVPLLLVEPDPGERVPAEPA